MTVWHLPERSLLSQVGISVSEVTVTIYQRVTVSASAADEAH